ncbi:MAG: ABC transporter ATP-binding protein, partial [Deltaproteobacteria bacterium]|nr:ABC transporter ATP-binding protein [Deltaproteobacteria bacterium]
VVMYASELVETSGKDDFYSNPLHPYSEALLKALPENGLEATTGFAPPRNDSVKRESCSFMERCPDAMERCSSAPPVVALSGRQVRCWKYAS